MIAGDIYFIPLSPGIRIQLLRLKGEDGLLGHLAARRNDDCRARLAIQRDCSIGIALVGSVIIEKILDGGSGRAGYATALQPDLAMGQECYPGIFRFHCGILDDQVAFK